MNAPSPLLVALLVSTALAIAGCTGNETTRLSIDFDGQAAAVSATVAFDGTRHAAHLYRAAGIPERDFVTVHDQLEAWSQTSGIPYEATSFNASFGTGFFLNAIAGITADGATAFWSLHVNGAESNLGMSDVQLRAGDRVAWKYTRLEADAGNADAGTGSLGLAVEPPQPTRDTTIALNGTLAKAATLSVGAHRLAADAGPWTLDVPLDYGQTPVRIVADDGTTTEQRNLILVRLAPATVSAEFASAVPPRANIQDEVWLDIDAHLSAPDYEGRNQPHPPHANIHDVLVAWAQAGRTLELSYHETFAFGVESIEGHGALSDWCYTLNGQTAELGITGQAFTPGDVIAWSGCFGV